MARRAAAREVMDYSDPRKFAYIDGKPRRIVQMLPGHIWKPVKRGRTVVYEAVRTHTIIVTEPWPAQHRAKPGSRRA